MTMLQEAKEPPSFWGDHSLITLAADDESKPTEQKASDRHAHFPRRIIHPSTEH